MLPCRSPVAVDAFCTRKRMQGTQERPCKSSVLYSMYREAHNHGTRKLHPNTHSASPVTTHSQKSMQSNYYTHSHNVRKKIQLYISRDYIYLINNYIQTRRVTTKAVFSSVAKFFCKWILLIWSTKWSLFINFFAQIDCKSRDESNDAN